MTDKIISEDSYNDKISELVKISGNNRCIDCNISNTQWTSKTFGIFLCFDCTSIHRSLGVNTSFVKSVNMDKWSKMEYLFMKIGGNDKFREFINKHNLQNKESNELYLDPAVKRYGEKLKSRVFEELGLNEQDYYKSQTKRKVENVNKFTNRFYEPESFTKDESMQSKLYDTFNLVSNSFIAGVKEVKNKTFEYGEKFSKSVILPSAKMIKSHSPNLTSLWKTSPKKEKDVERDYYKFEDEEIEDTSKWD